MVTAGCALLRRPRGAPHLAQEPRYVVAEPIAEAFLFWLVARLALLPLSLGFCSLEKLWVAAEEATDAPALSCGMAHRLSLLLATIVSYVDAW